MGLKLPYVTVIFFFLEKKPLHCVEVWLYFILSKEYQSTTAIANFY